MNNKTARIGNRIRRLEGRRNGRLEDANEQLQAVWAHFTYDEADTLLLAFDREKQEGDGFKATDEEDSLFARFRELGGIEALLELVKWSDGGPVYVGGKI